MSIVEKALERARAAPGAEAELRAVAAPGGAAARPGAPRVLAGGGQVRVASTIRIDQERLRAFGLLPPADGDSRRLTDEIRRIKWALLKALGSNDAGASAPRNVILVSSAVPGEGKSFTALNLALSMATEGDHRAWLIDTDAVRPHLSRALDIDERPGLLDVIASPEMTLEDALVGTDIPGLYVMPNGQQRTNAPELLGSTRASQLLASISRAYSDVVVILDSAPILATSIPQALAPSASHIVVAVKAEATASHAVTEALAQLHRTQNVSLVLNQVPRSRRSDYYTYYDYKART